MSNLQQLLATLLAATAVAAGVDTSAQPVDTSHVPMKHAPSPLPDGWQHGAFMEIFVRAYQDSDGDGIGDLRGLTARLDYLQDLGVRGLWLMPIQPNGDGDHGYATTEYRGIAPEYGTLEDFDELIAQAHARGIGVIMDYVINHSAAQHPLFVEARKGKGNPYRHWYVWSDTAPPGWDIWDKYPWYHTPSKPWLFEGHPKDLPKPAPEARDFYFGTFGPNMPDFNLRHPEVLAYHLSSLRFWLNRGLDGYRLDAVPHMVENDAVRWNDQPESRAMTRQLQDLVKAYPRRYVVCEATAEPAAYGDPSVCGGAFAFGYVHHFVEAARGQAESVKQLADYYRRASPTMATFVSSHDIFAGRRLWDQVGGDEARYRLAAAGYLLQPGTPFIYYGEEIGQGGTHCAPGSSQAMPAPQGGERPLGRPCEPLASLEGDLPLRSPMSWSAAPGTAGFTTARPFRPVAPNHRSHNATTQVNDPASLRAFYKAMLALRNGRPSIARGSFEHSFTAGDDGLVLGFQRRLGDERSLVLINYGTRAASINVPGLLASQRLSPLYPAHPSNTTGPALTLAPLSVQVHDIR